MQPIRKLPPRPNVTYEIIAVERLGENEVFKVVIKQLGHISIFFSLYESLGRRVSDNAFKVLRNFFPKGKRVLKERLPNHLNNWLLGLRNKNIILEPGKIFTGFRKQHGRLVFSQLEDIFAAVRQIDHIIKGYLGDFGEYYNLIVLDELMSQANGLLVRWSEAKNHEVDYIKGELLDYAEKFSLKYNLWMEFIKNKVENVSLFVSPPGALAAQTLAIRNLIKLRNKEIDYISDEMLVRREYLETEIKRSTGAVIGAIGQILEAQSECLGQKRIGKVRLHINKCFEFFTGVWAPPFYNHIKLSEGYLKDAFASADFNQISVYLTNALRHLKNIDLNPQKKEG